MDLRLVAAPGPDDIALVPLRPEALDGWLARQPARVREWTECNGFGAAEGSLCPVPGTGGRIRCVLVGLGPAPALWSLAGLPARLPPARYHLDGGGVGLAADPAALGWALGTYGFRRYRSSADEGEWPSLVWPEDADRAGVQRTAEAVFLVRDLINTPAADLGPAELAAAAEGLGRRHGAGVTVTVGDDLLATGYPAIHAVGRGAERAPRLIDLVWGDEAAPKVTLVGKGVCFDTGGLDIKPAAGMRLMKKDMGGAAHVLGLAAMIMDAGLPVRLRVLVPAVENSVSARAFRPLDVLNTRKGVTVEVGNTDAEGRLVLADALDEAGREAPDLLIDCATLTGAARAALGPDIPALFSNDDALAAALLTAAEAEDDPLWRLPLWDGYRRQLDSRVADLSNVSDSPFGGAITAALFLREFVPAGVAWAHLDMMAWNVKSRPGRPEGGEAMGLRALFAAIQGRFS